MGGNTGRDVLPNNSGIGYGTFLGSGVFGDEVEAQQLIGSPGTLSGLRVRASGDPGSGKSWTFTLFRNGSAEADLMCSVSGSATTCSDSTGSVSVVAGDTISIQVLAEGNTANNRKATWSLAWS